MSISAKLMAAVAAACIAAPTGAQYNPYPNQPGYDYPAYPGQQYPQQYPGQPYPGQTYPGQPYPGQQYPYGYNGAIGSMIDQLVGNRYNGRDRQAIDRCASAALLRATNRYPNGYAQTYPGYNRLFRVTAITDVQRRSSGLRVRGMLGGGMRYGYGRDRYGSADVSFRCDVDYAGYVRDVRLGDGYRSY
jgi:hypothetical protein